MVSKEKHTLIALSFSWLLWPVVVLSTLSLLWWAKRNTLLLLYPLPGCCGLHWFYLHYHSYGEQTHSYYFILFLAIVACVLSALSLLWWAKRNTLTTLSSSWLLWPVFCLHYHSYGEQRETHSYYFILFLAAMAGISFIYTVILLLFSTNPSTLMHVFVVGVHACMHSCAQVFTCICEKCMHLWAFSCHKYNQHFCPEG